MSNILGDMLKSVLDDVFGGRIYPGDAPAQPAGVPQVYGVYQYFGVPNVTLQGESDLRPQRVQIDVYSSSYREAEQLALDVARLMAAQSCYGSPSSFSSTPVTHQYFGRDPDVKLHRVMLEFSCWYRP